MARKEAEENGLPEEEEQEEVEVHTTVATTEKLMKGM